MRLDPCSNPLKRFRRLIQILIAAAAPESESSPATEARGAASAAAGAPRYQLFEGAPVGARHGANL